MCLTSTPNLELPGREGLFILDTDACAVQVGCTLLQQQTDLSIGPLYVTLAAQFGQRSGIRRSPTPSRGETLVHGVHQSLDGPADALGLLPVDDLGAKLCRASRKSWPAALSGR